MKKWLIILLTIILTSCGCPKVAIDPYYSDDYILSQLIEVYGARLDAYYNPSKDPVEKGNWILDVASEMDWEDLVNYIVNLPDFGTDSDLDELYYITGKEIKIE